MECWCTQPTLPLSMFSKPNRGKFIANCTWRITKFNCYRTLTIIQQSLSPPRKGIRFFIGQYMTTASWKHSKGIRIRTFLIDAALPTWSCALEMTLSFQPVKTTLCDYGTLTLIRKNVVLSWMWRRKMFLLTLLLVLIPLGWCSLLPGLNSQRTNSRPGFACFQCRSARVDPSLIGNLKITAI